LFALAFAVAFGVKLAVQFQIEAAIVQRRNLDNDLLSTAFWSLIGLSGAGALLLVGLAKPIGNVFGQPGTVPLLQLMSLYVLIDGLGGVPRAWLLSNLAFRKLTWVGLGSEGAATVVGVAAALSGAGALSLAIHAVVGSLFEVLLVWAR
jgi:O-antigen/teichoic acid export membrane protein